MRISSLRGGIGLVFVAGISALVGCGNEEIKLKDAPPAAIGAVKDEKATKNQSSLKSGAPPAGSSSGMRHNPSETPGTTK